MIKKLLYKFINTRLGWGLVAILPTVITDLIDNIIKLITLGYYVPSITFRWIAFMTLFKFKINKT